jgi:hypothetical protein
VEQNQGLLITYGCQIDCTYTCICILDQCCKAMSVFTLSRDVKIILLLLLIIFNIELIWIICIPLYCT